MNTSITITVNNTVDNIPVSITFDVPFVVTANELKALENMLPQLLPLLAMQQPADQVIEVDKVV